MQRGGEVGPRRRLVAGGGDAEPLAQQAPDAVAEQLAVVVAHVPAEAHHDDVELAGLLDGELERGDDVGHVAVAEARQDAGDVHLGIRADLLDHTGDERAVPGLEVERAAAVVVVLVLVVDAAGGSLQPRRVEPGARQVRVLHGGAGPVGPQARVEDEDPSAACDPRGRAAGAATPVQAPGPTSS